MPPSSLHRDDGVDAEVVNVAIIKPLESEAVLASLARTGVAVTAEEHRKVGGLADAIREVAAEQYPVPVFAVGVGDTLRRLRHRRGRDGALRADRRRDRRHGARRRSC